jgi:hypothetical protein
VTYFPSRTEKFAGLVDFLQLLHWSPLNKIGLLLWFSTQWIKIYLWESTLASAKNLGILNEFHENFHSIKKKVELWFAQEIFCVTWKFCSKLLNKAKKLKSRQKGIRIHAKTNFSVRIVSKHSRGKKSQECDVNTRK